MHVRTRMGGRKFERERERKEEKKGEGIQWHAKRMSVT
jgi:hypothetical protein